MEETNQCDKNVTMFQNLVKSDGNLEAPICIAENLAKPLLLNELKWSNWGEYSKLKVTNTGHTAMVTGKWSKNGRPSVCGGPFTESYRLAQIHFHWGYENSVGSEHMLNGQRFPLEMHVLLYRTSLKKPKLALNDPRGLALLVYFFEVSESENQIIELISNHTKNLKPFHSASIECDISDVVKPFTNNYYLYWGSLVSKHCSHIIIWLVHPNRLNISAEQLNNFRMMLNTKGSHIKKNYGCVKPLYNRNVFHVLQDVSEYMNHEKEELSSYDTNNIEILEMTDKNRFCCLSVKRKPKLCSIQEIMKSLNHLELQTHEKIQILEELSRQIILKDAKERNKLLKTIENQVQRNELKSILSNKGFITVEIFNQLKLRNVFFKNVKREIMNPSSKNDQKGTVESNPTLFIRNTLFRETSESETSENMAKPIFDNMIKRKQKRNY